MYVVFGLLKKSPLTRLLQRGEYEICFCLPRQAFSRFFVLFVAFILFITLCSLTGCSSKPSKFYVLNTLPLQAAKPIKHRVYLGVGPITVPEYLQQPQIVSRLEGNNVKVNEFQRWAEPLQDAVERILTQNLALLVPSETISTYPWTADTRVDYRVIVEVVCFEPEPGGESVLLARWRITNKDDSKTYIARTAQYHYPSNLKNYNEMVASMNQNLSHLSQDIAEHIRHLH